VPSAIIASMTLPSLWQHPSNYKISTEVYEGPLDLLLTLIEQSELDITKLSLAQVTNEYLNHLKSISYRDPTEVSAFLVIGAKLVLIKSSILLPSTEGEIIISEEDIGDQLARQLIEYKKFKEKALWLGERQNNGLRSYLRVAQAPLIKETLDLSGIKIYDLVDILMEIYFQNENVTPLSDVVSITAVTLKKRIKEIVEILTHSPKQRFSHLLPDEHSRLDLIVTFLALLELIKNNSVVAGQNQLFGDIDLESTQDLTKEFETEL
jgi:segregation and condensation protein A